jgi:aminoglycoside N3'-acetyltransferase
MRLDGQVLLLGVGHDANTTIHLAEYLAGGVTAAKKYVTLIQTGSPSASNTVRSIIVAAEI